MSFDDEERPSRLPWMARAEVGKEYEFEASLNSMHKREDAGPDGEWNSYQVEMRDIHDDEGDEFAEEGSHEIPFWAMVEFYDACARRRAKSSKKDWFPFTYERKEVAGKSLAVIR